MPKARFDAQAPSGSYPLPLQVQNFLRGPRPSEPRWLWLLERGLLEPKVRDFLASSKSRRLYQQLCKHLQLDRSQWQSSDALYPNFDRFLARSLHPQARPIEGGEQSISFPLDGGHYLIENLQPESRIPLSPWQMRADELFDFPQLWQSHSGGSLLVSHPLVSDCHRVSYPLAGASLGARIAARNRPTPGPKCLRRLIERGLPRIHCEALDSRHAGRVLISELGDGASSIVQSHSGPHQVLRAEPKSWLRLGNNWVLCLFAPGRIYPDADLPVFAAKELERRGPVLPKEQLRALRGQRFAIAT